MSDEPAVDEERENKSIDKWKPALKTVLTLIVVLAVIDILKIIISVVVSNFRPSLGPWMDYTGQGSLYDAILNLLYGGVLLMLAGLLVPSRDWYALFDKLQQIANRRTINQFLIGLIVGALAIFAVDLVWMLSGAYLFKGHLVIGFEPELIKVAALYIIPLLAVSIGEVALIQGYLQRTVSHRYGGMLGIIAAAIFYMALVELPNFFVLLSDPIHAAPYTAHAFFTGVIIAYMFYLSKSPYMSIGFTYAFYLFSWIWIGFMTVIFVVKPIPTFLGLPQDVVSYELRVLTLFLILSLVFYFGDKSERFTGLKGKLKNAIDIFLSRL